MDILCRDKYRKLIPSNSQHTESDCALRCDTVNVLISAYLHFDILLVATLSQRLQQSVCFDVLEEHAKSISRWRNLVQVDASVHESKLLESILTYIFPYSC